MDILTADTTIIHVNTAVILLDNSNILLHVNITPVQLINQTAVLETDCIVTIPPEDVDNNFIVRNYNIKMIILSLLLFYVSLLFFIIYILNSKNNKY
tara:strand:+ start:279 stop:569 length:291 start_codon:yes stop_codon:yes gene_type:complete